MNYHTNNHISISHVDTDAICRITACIADTILRPLYDFANRRDLFGYKEALEIVSEWAKEFYAQYYSKIQDWDTFEESEENKYNAITWDDFASNWANDRFKKYKLEMESDIVGMKTFGNTSIPKIAIVHRGNQVASVYSTIPVMYAVIDYDSDFQYWITATESDTVAEDLCTLFDSDEPVDASIVKQFKQIGF